MASIKPELVPTLALTLRAAALEFRRRRAGWPRQVDGLRPNFFFRTCSPGGTGKTRLSLQIAAEVLPEFKDGAWLIELAPLSAPEYLLPALAATLGLREQRGLTLLAVVQGYLSGKTLLLILDSCEHLVEACAHVAQDLLAATRPSSPARPGLKILASSREGLGWPGRPYTGCRR